MLADPDERVTVVVGPRSLSLTLRFSPDVVAYVEAPLPHGVGSLASGDVHRIARAQAVKILRAAADELA